MSARASRRVHHNDYRVIAMTTKSILGFAALVKKNLQTHMARLH
jgi:hypothetical protein